MDKNESAQINVLDANDVVRASAFIYAAPGGSSSNGGTSYSDALDAKTAIQKAAAGDTVLLQAGTYKIPFTSGSKNSIVCSKSGSSAAMINVQGDGGQATIDFQCPSGSYVQDSFGLSVTGSYYYFKNITITRAAYQGAYVTGGYNTFDTCNFNDNRCTGLEINKGGNHTTVTNCVANNNYDPKKTGTMADGFGPKQTQGAGNKFINCSATGNSDDGYDCYDSDQVVTFEGCKAYNSGSTEGNGQGFKLGGNNKVAKHTLKNCISSNNKDVGYHANSNPGPIYCTNCTGSGNGGGLTSGSGIKMQ